METNNSIDMLYYDPFAEEGQEYFNPIESFNLILDNYQLDKVEHDNAADLFVARTEALMLDSQFLERFDAVQAIAAQMHNMCGEDHNIRNLMNKNPIFGTGEHSKDDGHGHAIDSVHSEHDDDEDDEYEYINGRKVKKKKT
jgi:hypothetical protein